MLQKGYVQHAKVWQRFRTMCGVLGDHMPMPRVSTEVDLTFDGAGPGFRDMNIRPVASGSVTGNGAELLAAVPDDEVWVADYIYVSRTGVYDIDDLRVSNGVNTITVRDDAAAASQTYAMAPPLELQPGYRLRLTVSNYVSTGVITAHLYCARYKVPNIA